MNDMLKSFQQNTKEDSEASQNKKATELHNNQKKSNLAKKSNEAKTNTVTKSSATPQKITKPTKQEIKNTPFKVTRTEVKSKKTTSNNNSGHMLQMSAMLDIHVVAQLTALKSTLHLKNRSQAVLLLMNKRQTLSDVIGKLSPKDKTLYKARYNIFLADHLETVKRNYRKYHEVK